MVRVGPGRLPSCTILRNVKMGPLAGIKIVELAGIGPCPMCGMLLAELGADVLKLDRVHPSGLGLRVTDAHAFLHRSRRSVAVNLKLTEGTDLALRLVDQADALIEGFRPGTTERLGLGPDTCLERNPKLVYGRVTGWGQTGPLSQTAGHDLNYIALTGALHAIGRAGQPPTPPLNLVGDFGGGALYLALGVVAALLDAQRTGHGQIVDAAMIDGAASLMTGIYALLKTGLTTDTRGVNVLDSGAHFYEVYETRDRRYIALAPIEPRFYAVLLDRLGLTPNELPHSTIPEDWPDLKAKLAALIKTRTRDEWTQVLGGTDACFAPVLSQEEAPHHPHNEARATFVQEGGWQPNAAPRFSRTPSRIRSAAAPAGAHTREALIDWGVESDEVDRLLATGAIVQRA